jgi:hypothetical protein
VVRIGSLEAEEALRRLAEATSVDGPMEHVWAASRLAEAYYLRGMNAISSTTMATLVVQPPGGRRRSISVATLPVEMPGRQDKLLAPHGVQPPLFLGNVDQTFWHRSLPAHDAYFVQINNLLDTENETLDAYGQRLWADLQSGGHNNLILDLRHNNGGTTQHYSNLLRTVVAFSRDPARKVYVLLGRRTYSAAANFLTDLERLADPVFVGEPSSECCALFGDPASVRLPYSRIQGEFTAMKWNLSYPMDQRREITPHVPVQLTASDYFSGRDPSLDAVFRIIMVRRREAGTTPPSSSVDTRESSSGLELD